MKIIVTLLGLLNGVYMLSDGIFVLLKGKYIGPDKPGPWAIIFYKFNINVFKLGPVFIVLGLLWLIFLFGLWTNQHWAWLTGLTICILTLWYVPVGTITSVVILMLLLTFKTRLGL